MPEGWGFYQRNSQASGRSWKLQWAWLGNPPGMVHGGIPSYTTAQCLCSRWVDPCSTKPQPCDKIPHLIKIRYVIHSLWLFFLFFILLTCSTRNQYNSRLHSKFWAMSLNCLDRSTDRFRELTSKNSLTHGPQGSETLRLNTIGYIFHLPTQCMSSSYLKLRA